MYIFLTNKTISIIIVKCLSFSAKKMEFPGPFCTVGPHLPNLCLSMLIFTTVMHIIRMKLPPFNIEPFKVIIHLLCKCSQISTVYV